MQKSFCQALAILLVTSGFLAIAVMPAGAKTLEPVSQKDAAYQEETTNAGNVLGQSRTSNCSSYLRLYDGVYYTGSVLYLRARLTWINLTNYGFNQRASSFKIGACSAIFADYANGGGAWYPMGDTQAYHQSLWMTTGWNNDVSSVWIS